MLTFRRSRYTYKWCAFGLASDLKEGAVVKVNRLNGAPSLKRIGKVFAPFEREDGEMWAYASISVNDVCSECRDAEVQPNDGSSTCQICQAEALGLLA